MQVGIERRDELTDLDSSHSTETDVVRSNVAVDQT